jgi:hypothetical protein
MSLRTVLVASVALGAALSLAGCESQGGTQPAPKPSAVQKSEPSSTGDRGDSDIDKHGADEMTKKPEPRDDDAEPFERHAWEHRPVVVFAPSPESETYEQQREIFRSREEGLRDREIVVYHVFTDGGVRGPDGRRTDAVGRALRERFQPEGRFAVVLVGKDTTEKLRTRDVLSAEKLFETIDAMPMRQREMREDD